MDDTIREIADPVSRDAGGTTEGGDCLEHDVHITMCSSGHWSVVGSRGRRGGRFVDLAAARRFAQREFGPDARIDLQADVG